MYYVDNISGDDNGSHVDDRDFLPSIMLMVMTNMLIMIMLMNMLSMITLMNMLSMNTLMNRLKMYETFFRLSSLVSIFSNFFTSS